MVLLPTQQILNNLGIDTVERAIIFSATLLRSLYVANSDRGGLDRTIQITNQVDADKTAYVLIEANIPYDIVKANEEGGLPIEYVINQDYPFTYDLVNYACTNTFDLVSPLPYLDGTTYDCLEKFFVFYCYLLQASLDSVSDTIAIAQRDSFSQESGRLNINIRLPFDYDVWLSGSNYVCSSLYSGLTYKQLPLNFANRGISILDNETILNNQVILQN